MTGNEIIKYQAGEDTITLSPDIIRKSLVSGDGTVTDQEIAMFLKLCEYQHLNPFLKEVYLIKYGSSPATMITGKATFLKRAYNHPKYRGHKTGISTDGLTAWAEVYVDEYTTPIKCEVDYDEYVGKKKDGSITKIWRTKPVTMLTKVSKAQAKREANPEDLARLYLSEEFDQETKPTEKVIKEIDDTEEQKLPDNKPKEEETSF